MKKFAIIYETFYSVVKNRQRYYKHIVCMVLSIATVIVLQCMSRAILPLFFSSDENSGGWSLITVRCEPTVNDDSIDTAVLSEPEITAVLNATCKCFPIISEPVCSGEIPDIRENVDIEAVSEGFWLGDTSDMLSGSPLTDPCWNTGNSATVISDKTAKAVFGDTDVCGQSIHINTKEYGLMEFTVCGVYLSDKLSGGENETVYVSRRYMTSHYHTESELCEEITYAITGDMDRQKLSQALLPLNIATSDSSLTLAVEYSDDKENTASGFVNFLMDILLVFAVLAFFLSNIGIMNMTFIMIGRRTKEIGIRKAVGGQMGDIRLQIITESNLTAMAGSLLGILCGLIVGNAILLATEKFAMHGEVPLQLCIPWGSIILSTSGTFILSTLLSLFPANKAAHMTAIDAIRSRE